MWQVIISYMCLLLVRTEIYAAEHESIRPPDLINIFSVHPEWVWQAGIYSTHRNNETQLHTKTAGNITLMHLTHMLTNTSHSSVSRTVSNNLHVSNVCYLFKLLNLYIEKISLLVPVCFEYTFTSIRMVGVTLVIRWIVNYFHIFSILVMHNDRQYFLSAANPFNFKNCIQRSVFCLSN